MRQARASRVKFSISILAHNKLELTKKCIESVMQGGSGFELILTDNASTDGTAEYFAELAKLLNVTVITHEKNLGFNEPNNIALTKAKGAYFITLNNDAEVPRGWLTHLEKPFKEFTTAGISGPVGSCCSLQARYPSFHGSPGSLFEYVEGSCLCIPTALARKIGLFATYLKFAYGEDVDLSLRVRARGLTIHQVPFEIKHQRSATSRDVPFIKEVEKQNHASMIQRWGNYHVYRKFNLPFVVRRMGAIGDVLLTTPLIRAIKEQQPEGEIFVETLFPELFINNPHVTKAGHSFSNVYKWANFINLDMSYENRYEIHIIQAYLDTARFMQHDWSVDIFPTDQDFLTAKALLGDKKWCAVHAGPTTWTGKNWPEDRFQQVCQWLADNEWKVVLVGNPGYSLPHYLDMRGKTTFQSLAAIMRQCKLFVGVDSFPIHVAQSQGVPVIGLFGASSPQYILTDESPRADIVGTSSCQGERHRVRGKTFTQCDGSCMRSIGVNQVIRAIESLS